MPMHRAAVAALFLMTACAGARMLPAPPGAPGFGALPLRSTKGDVLAERAFGDPRSDAIFFAAARPQAAIVSSGGGGADLNFFPVEGGDAVRALIFDPGDPRFIVARSGPRMLRSADGGATWTQMVPADGEEKADRIDAAAIAADGAIHAASAGALFVSSDRGRSWRRLQLPVPSARSDPASARYRVRSIAAHPSQAGTLFVSIEARPAADRPFLARLTNLLDGTSSEAIEALGLYDAQDSSPRTFGWGDSRAGVYVTHDRGGLWQKTGLSLDAWLHSRGDGLYAVLADPIFEAAGLARRSPELAAAVGKQLHGFRLDAQSLRAAVVFPGRERLLLSPMAAAIVYRSTDEGATWTRLRDPPLAVAFALREEVERQKAARVELREDGQERRGRSGGGDRGGRGGGGRFGGRGGGGGRRGGGGAPQEEAGPPAARGGPRAQLVEPLLTLLDPARLLAAQGPLVPLTGVASSGDGLYAYAPTETYWERLVDALVRGVDSQGEIGVGFEAGADPGPGAAFELLRSSDGGATWTPVADAAAPGYPAQIAASRSQAIVLVIARRKGAPPSRTVWRYLER